MQPVSKSKYSNYVVTKYCYWAGYYWHIWSDNEKGILGLYAMPSVCHDGSGSVKEDDKLPGVHVSCFGALAIVLPHPIHKRA